MHEKPTVMRQREGCAGGGKGPLMSEDKSLTLAANANDQVLFVPDTTHTLKAEGHDASEDGTGRGVPLILCGIDGGEVGYSLRANPSRSGDKGDGGVNCTLAVAHSVCLGSDPIHARELAQPITRRNGDPGTIQTGMAVRRLTPRECERLQGFPDDYTRIPRGTYKHRKVTKTWPADLWTENPDGTWTLYAADGPRYKALGNSMAVPVMHWIGQRIAQVEDIIG